MNKRLFAFAGFTIALLAAVLWGRHMLQGDGEIPVVKIVQAQPMIQKLLLVGRIEPAITVTLTAPFDGDLSIVKVEVGQEVEAGDAVFELGITELSKNIYDARAEMLRAKRAANLFDNWEHSPDAVRANRALTTAKTQLADSESKLTDARTLFEQGIIPRMEVDALALQVDAAKMATRTAEEERRFLMDRRDDFEARLVREEFANAVTRTETLQILTQKRTVTAPFSGIVVDLPQSGTDNSGPARPLVGRSVLRGQPVLGLVSAAQIKATVRIDETDLSKLNVGQPVVITGDAFEGLTLFGKIAALGTQALQGTPDGGAARYEVTVAIPPLSSAQRKLVRLGMSANLEITTYANPEAVLLPPNAVRDIQGKFYAQLAVPSEGSNLVEVKRGRTFAAGTEIIGIPQGVSVVINH